MNIYLNEELSKALIMNNVETYGAAYDGESAAIDLYHASAFTTHVAGNLPSKRTLIPTGLHISLPAGWVGLIRGRGSITKTPLILHAGVIDPGYTGEIFVAASHTQLPSVHGVGASYSIPPYAKLPFQMVVVPFRNDFNIVSKEVYNESVEGAKRLAGRIGSSD